MKIPVLLTICGKQFYDEHEPEVIELVTEGTLEAIENGWEIYYEESSLTGMEGINTLFRIQPDKITLVRSGRLNSQMEFQLGVLHHSLYQMEFGALMIAVTARQVLFDLTPEGGFVDLVYDIEIENTASGVVDYHLDIRAIEG